MNIKSTHDRNYEPIARVDQRLRELNQPTGLRNIGNTCYFNSLLQVYFTLPRFVTSILSFEVEILDEEEKKEGVGSQDAGPGEAGKGKPDHSAL